MGRTSWSVSMALLATKIHENPRRSPRGSGWYPVRGPKGAPVNRRAGRLGAPSGPGPQVAFRPTCPTSVFRPCLLPLARTREGRQTGPPTLWAPRSAPRHALTERTQFPPKSHKTQGQKCRVRCGICLGEADHKQRWSAPLVPGFEEFSMRLSSHFQNYTSGASVRNSIRGR